MIVLKSPREIELLREAAVATEQHGTCRGQEGQARFARNDVGAQDEHAAVVARVKPVE